MTTLKFVCGVLMIISASISFCASDNDIPIATKQDNFVKFIAKTWKHCMNVPTLGLCFKQRSLMALDHLIKSKDPIEFPGEIISIVKYQDDLSFQSRTLSEKDLVKHLPKDPKFQDKTLDLLLETAYKRFLATRFLQIRFPTSNLKEIDESRGDKKKGNGFAMGAMMAAMMMIPMALAGIGMLAGKSLMVSMLALMMSALLASKKSHEGGGSSYEVISVPAGGHHHHGRRMSISTHDVAYNAHADTQDI